MPQQSLMDALEIMGDEDVGWVPIVAAKDDDSFLGWITVRDAAVYLGVFDKRPSMVMCSGLIAAPPAVLAPDDDLDQARTRARAEHWRVRRLPVVQSGKLAGVVGLE